MDKAAPNEFYDSLNEIKELYAEVKEVIILAENFDPTHEVYLSPLNELRNTLDHVMRSLIYPDKLENEINEAKEHLYRAGYDAYEVLAINVADNIIKIIEQYDASIITIIFPKYYTEVRPALVDTKVELANERAHKRLNPETGTKSFTPYKEKVANLIHQLRVCNEQVPALQTEKNKLRNKKLKERVLSIAIGIAIGIVGIVLGTFIYDRYIKSETPKTFIQPAKTDSSKKLK